jgi:hypothetical protein
MGSGPGWARLVQTTFCRAIYGGVGLMPVSPMSEEFHDWLDQCPVQWFRGEVTKDNVTYIFETPDEDED